jgi:prevent-host-death family protein
MECDETANSTVRPSVHLDLPKRMPRSQAPGTVSAETRPARHAGISRAAVWSTNTDPWLTIMKEVAIYEAKTRLSELLAAVEHGEQITITRRGRPVARLVAIGPVRREASQRQRVTAVFARMRQQRTGITPEGDLRETIAAGRD